MRTRTLSLRRRRVGFTLAALCVAAAIAAGFLSASTPVRAAGACPWMDPSKTPEQRAQQLLAAMTLDEKLTMVHGNGDIFVYYGMAGHIPANPALCIPDLTLNDAGAGVGDGQLNTTAFPTAMTRRQRGIKRCSGGSASRSAGRRGTRASTSCSRPT